MQHITAEFQVGLWYIGTQTRDFAKPSIIFECEHNEHPEIVASFFVRHGLMKF
jgi:hypothetical protein